jgi:septal ring factor EnvC (AmiA/AmiB activator)
MEQSIEERLTAELAELRQELARVTAARDRYQAKGKQLLAQHRALEGNYARLELAYYRSMNELLSLAHLVDDENGPFIRKMKHIYDCIQRTLW